MVDINEEKIEELIKQQREAYSKFVKSFKDSTKRALHSNTYKPIIEYVSKHPKGALIATAGLGIFLFASAINHKKQQQAEGE